MKAIYSLLWNEFNDLDLQNKLNLYSITHNTTLALILQRVKMELQKDVFDIDPYEDDSKVEYIQRYELYQLLTELERFLNDSKIEIDFQLNRSNSSQGE